VLTKKPLKYGTKLLWHFNALSGELKAAKSKARSIPESAAFAKPIAGSAFPRRFIDFDRLPLNEIIRMRHIKAVRFEVDNLK
jgi:hypothetical protein